MKKLIIAVVLGCLGAFSASATINTNRVVNPPHVKWYTFPTTLPNDADISSFPIARATVMNGIVLHGCNPMTTGSRSNNPAAVGIQRAFEAGDIIVVDPGLTSDRVWRSQINPVNTNYAGKIGSRVYVPYIAVANTTNKISLSGFSFSVIDTKGDYLSSQSALMTNYSITEVGIIKGPSGQLFANDQTLVTSGSATNPVDALVFIGARVGANILQNGSLGVAAVNSYIGNGILFRFIYSYAWNSVTNGNTTVNVENNERDVMVYQDGQTPSSYNWMWEFPTPRGMLFSLEAPEANTYTTSVARRVDGVWFPSSSTATTGWSYQWDFTGAPVNDMGYVKFQQNAPPVVFSSALVSIVPHSLSVGTPTDSKAQVVGDPTDFFKVSN